MRTSAFVLTGILLFAGAWTAQAAEGMDEVVKLAQSGLGEDVLMAYVEASPTAYDLSVADIVYLSDLGIPQKVIAAMVTHGKELRDKAAPQAPAPAVAEVLAVPAPEPPAAPAPPPAETAPAPAAAPPPVYEAGQTVAAAPVREPAVEIVRRTPVIVAPEEADISYFYESLSPYGSWVSVGDYGWVWQPTVVLVDSGWRPYLNRGYWVWTDCGWYWHSDYTWGWAPFHYGRWVHHDRHRWVWVPDHVWGPAWVHWRHSDNHYGWAPLPPRSTWDSRFGFSFHGRHVGFDFDFHLGHRDYSFVPHHRFLDHALAPVAVPQPQVVNIFNQTTVVNNAYVFNDNRIINQGIPVASVSQVTQRHIQPLRLADASARPGQVVSGERLTDGKLFAFRPHIANKVTAEPPQIAARRAKALPPQPPGTPGAGPTKPPPVSPLDRDATVGSRITPGREHPKNAVTPVLTPPGRRDVTPPPTEPTSGPVTPPPVAEPKRGADTHDQDQAEALRRRQQEEALRKQQDAARKLTDQQAQDAARRQQEEALRRQQDAARQQQGDALRRQQDAARQQQEAARRQQEDALRRQQEAARRQPEPPPAPAPKYTPPAPPPPTPPPSARPAPPAVGGGADATDDDPRSGKPRGKR